MTEANTVETATAKMERINLRRRRAAHLTSVVTRELDRAQIPNEYRQDIFEAIFKIFEQEGVEVLTDFDRQHHGLPSRGPDGWTTDEIKALEFKRLESLTKPISPMILARE